MEKITNISSTRNGNILRKIAKKSKLISLLSHEYIFFIETPNNTWWIDSNSIIHIVNTIQGFLNLRKLKENKGVFI